eukprot:scaffold17932_cov58-Phaeocystis_antarctica.AAC.6
MPLRTHLRREGDLVEHHVRHLGRRCTHAVLPLLVLGHGDSGLRWWEVVVGVSPRLRQPLVYPAGRELDVAEGGGRGVEGDRVGPAHRCLEVVGVAHLPPQQARRWARGWVRVGLGSGSGLGLGLTLALGFHLLVARQDDVRVLRELLIHGGSAALHLALQEKVRQARDVAAVRPARVGARQPRPTEQTGPFRVRLGGWKAAASVTLAGPHGRTAASHWALSGSVARPGCAAQPEARRVSPRRPGQ